MIKIGENMRKPIIAGNWKMYKTMDETLTFVELLDDFAPKNVEAVLCVAYTNLIILKRYLNKEVKIGSQNIHWDTSGAFTGEISPLMLQELNVKYAIIGHSERRQMFGETDLTVNKKVVAAIKHNITPIICVGEKLEERELGKTDEIVKNQIEKALKGLPFEQASNLVIAYEPIWAIGTGESSTADAANGVIGFIRKTIANQFDGNVADQIRIQYGGSVNPDNIEAFMEQPEIDGALVGGASLDPEDFKALIIGAAKKYK